MMLEGLGARDNSSETLATAGLIRRAVETAFADGSLVTCELGGKAGTADVYKHVTSALESLDV